MKSGKEKDKNRMILQLIDNTKHYNEKYTIEDTYRSMWESVFHIVKEKNYSCSNYTLPEIDEQNHIIRIRWEDLFGILEKEVYIEITNYSDKVLKLLQSEINWTIKVNERRKAVNFKAIK